MLVRLVLTLALLAVLPVPAAAAAPPVVAVLDSGADLHHPVLRGLLWTDPAQARRAGADGDDDDGDVHGADMVDGDDVPADASGHGTHVAALVARRPSHGWRPSGARIMAVRVLADGRGRAQHLAQGLDYAVDHGARIVNLSVGGYAPHPILDAALERATDAGALLVVAAGNERRNLDVAPLYPAAFHGAEAIVVAASEGSHLAAFTSFGPSVVDIAAPGERVYSALPGGRYGWMTGTSQATAAVTRTAALVWRAHPDLRAAEVRAAILRSARARAAMAGWTATGGTLDERAALRRAARIAARRP